MIEKIKKMIIYLSIGVLLICGGCEKTDTLIEYHRTGGFIGLDDSLIIYRDGNVSLQRKANATEFKLDDDTISHLETMLNDSDFTELEKEYLPSRKGGDLIEYKITYNGYTIRMMDTVIPDVLQPILELLNQIVENSH